MSLRQMPRCSPDATPPLVCPLSIQHTYSDSPRRDSQAHALPQLNKITTRGQTFQCNHTATYTISNLKLIQQYPQSLQHDWTASSGLQSIWTTLSEPSANLDRSQSLQFGWTILRAFGLTGTPSGLQSIRTAHYQPTFHAIPPQDSSHAYRSSPLGVLNSNSIDILDPGLLPGLHNQCPRSVSRPAFPTLDPISLYSRLTEHCCIPTAKHPQILIDLPENSPILPHLGTN